MPARPLKKKKAKKIRYRKITFKLTDSQKKLLDAVSKRHRTTPNRLMKKAIREYLLRYADAVAADSIVTENQLRLFDDDIFEEEEEVEEENCATGTES